MRLLIYFSTRERFEKIFARMWDDSPPTTLFTVACSTRCSGVPRQNDQFRKWFKIYNHLEFDKMEIVRNRKTYVIYYYYYYCEDKNISIRNFIFFVFCRLNSPIRISTQIDFTIFKCHSKTIIKRVHIITSTIRHRTRVKKKMFN